MKILFKFLTLSILLFLTSCTKETELLIEDEIEVYFIRFAEEAALRGIEIDFNELNVEGYFSEISEVGVVGQCQTFSDSSKDLVIETRYWQRIDDIEKEFLIFHELGHCVLERSHIDTQDENGFCNSIMQSGSGECIDNYNLDTREAYLDELFIK
ncbi:MAG: Zn-dependent peptidase ImmA (M78 family) [Saprospiraceae bacterium]|jgi:Zn-dependent peptidase ImmA (M78 family)